VSQPTSNQLKQALELIDGAKSIDEAKTRLKNAIAGLDRLPVEDASGGGARVRGRSYFDRLIERMLDQVKRAESRETLIKDTLRALADDPIARAGTCYLVLEGFVFPNGDISEMAVSVAEAVHPQRLDNFVRDRLPKLAGSRLIRDVMVERETCEFLATSYLRDVSYFGEFDDLVDLRRQDAWICALPLPPADANRPSRMLIAIYPMVGSADSPSLPRGASQEWRTLTFMRAAYDMLNHQLASTAELVAQQRREILADLGPGLVNHEINQQLKVLDESANLVNWGVQKLESEIPGDNRALDAVIHGLANVLNAIERLYSIADAFNNLERRPTEAPFSIAGLIGEIATLLNYKIALVGAELTCSGDTQVEIVTDASLVEHVLINILANALEATEGKGEDRSDISRLHIKCRSADGRVEIDVLNNGPPVAIARPERIFEKGFTTKTCGLGHGLGLYLCRIIMNYLGGTITLIDKDELQAGFNVGFRLDMPVQRTGSDDISLYSSSNDGDRRMAPSAVPKRSSTHDRRQTALPTDSGTGAGLDH
jgi:signal transduction histidine kinase